MAKYLRVLVYVATYSKTGHSFWPRAVGSLEIRRPLLAHRDEVASLASTLAEWVSLRGTSEWGDTTWMSTLGRLGGPGAAFYSSLGSKST